MKRNLLFIVLFLGVILGNAQITKSRTASNSSFGSKFKRFITKTPWTVGLSGHVVDDDGQPFKNLFNVKDSWNFYAFPARLTIDGYYVAGFSFQTEFAFTQYKVNKVINSERIQSSGIFFSTDFHVKYDLNELIGPTNWFDPYVSGGYGYTMRTAAVKPHTATANLGLGANFWIYENLGLNLQTMAKFSMIEGTSNYLHHSVGVVYRLIGGQGSRPGKLGQRYKFISHGKR